jgi:hypothetical protein
MYGGLIEKILKIIRKEKNRKDDTKKSKYTEENVTNITMEHALIGENKDNRENIPEDIVTSTLEEILLQERNSLFMPPIRCRTRVWIK